MTISAATQQRTHWHHPARISAWFADDRSLWGILAFSLLIKIVLAATGPVINPDGVLYIAAAREFAAGNFSAGLDLYPMPSFPLLVAAAHLLVHDWVAAARTITIAFMVLATIPLYKLTALLFDRRAAFWAAVLLAVAPEANENALRVIRDPAFVCLALTAVFFTVKGLQRQQVRWIAAGFAAACGGLLFRIEGIVLLAAPAAFLLLQAMVDKDADRRSFAIKSAVFWVGLPLAVGLVLGLVFGPQIATQNRIDELAGELRDLVRHAAFEKYRQIYAYFQQIQSEPPFSGFSHSLPATVRHWMPLIYGIGLLESLAKQVYPLFLLPLFLNLGKRARVAFQWTPEKRFVLIVFGVYLLFLYYFLVTRDRMVGRLLLTPALLLYPWVGRGFSLGLDALSKVGSIRALQLVVVVVFLALPAAKSAEGVITVDRSAVDVGRFIRQDPALRDATVLFSETPLCLYAGRLQQFQETMRITKQINDDIREGRPADVEAAALKHNADALVLFFNDQSMDNLPVFKQFHEYKRIPGRKGVTVIYRVHG